MKLGIGIALAQIAIATPAAVTAQDRAFFGRGEILAGTGSRRSVAPGASGGVRLGGSGNVPLGGPGYPARSAAPRTRSPLAGTTSRFVRRGSPTPFDVLADGFVDDPIESAGDSPPL